MKKNWKNVRLGDVCIVIAGQSPEGKFYNKEGIGTPFYQGKKEFGSKYINSPKTWTTEVTKIAEKNDILMSVRAPVGPINFAVEKICIGRGLAAIRCSDSINKDYLFSYLLSIQHKLKGNAGAVFNSINKSQIEQIELFLPDINEQLMIVDKIESVFEQIDMALDLNNQKRTLLSQLKLSTLNRAFTGQFIKE